MTSSADQPARVSDQHGENATALGSEAFVSLSNVSVVYQHQGSSLTAVSSIDLQISQGEVVALVGTSGCGKTSILRVIAGLQVPATGKVQIAGTDAVSFRRTEGVGFCSQHPVMFEWRTMLENVVLPAELRRSDIRSARERAVELLGRVGLRGFENARPAQLSSGMKQRAMLVRALLTPQLLLLDESFSAVDEFTREALWLMVRGLWHDCGSTVCLVTHSIREAVFLAQRVIVLTPRPARVRASFEIQLPEDRGQEMFVDPEFHALCDEVRACLV